ncbi:hypothetical protein ACHQM5_018255 [Ranunculus cassubicifolius]
MYTSTIPIPNESKISSQKLLKIMQLPFLYYVLVVLSYMFMKSVSGATLLPDSEVNALREIGKTLGKNDWDFSVDPCSKEAGWENITTFEVQSNVTCSCSSIVCNVVSIVLRGQDLSGVLPPELVKLPFLQQIDLTRNYLNGSIPKVWGSMKLVNISLDGNRLSGGLPIELANISTLANLTLDFNYFSGVLPSELGNMASIEKWSMNSNNFTGPLPETFAKLTTLTDFQINDNHFTGKIPEFIQNWTNLTRISIQASGLEGPIPSGISRLTKMSDMRISDLTGRDFAFPLLNNMTSLITLVLRSCNIIGGMPSFLGSLTQLKIIDLSFNKLTGQLPGSIGNLRNANFLYVTGNVLNGPVPTWNTIANIDLSYNNFTVEGASSPNCQMNNVNVFGRSFLSNKTTGTVPCLKSFQCLPNPTSSFHINCGGGDFTANGNTKFVDNTEAASASRFILKSENNWGFCTTGDFMDDGSDKDIYIATASSDLTMSDPELYTRARISPISLTYYGFCLINGKYTVSLHFAEIQFPNDNTFGSLGRRIFDIYIQGKIVRKDFNIKDEAGGANKAIILPFTADVNDETIEIRFHWAGKGTTEVPSVGTYGPLISAISIVPQFKVSSDNGKDGNKISIAIVVGIVVAVLSLVVIMLVFLWWIGCFREKKEIDKDLRGLDLQTGSFTLRQIRAATNNFHASNKIGEGGFGPVYKGNLLDGTVIAVKKLSSKSNQGNREFVNEIGMISALQHPNLVRLYGCSIEGDQLLLVYEYMENNSLASVLFDQEECLDWRTRHRICVDIARALAYLHEGSRLKIIHRDIKATNILLDKDLNAKVSDFGLAKLNEEDASHISTRIAGTRGYMAPEYAMRGHLTEKADVYSFGVVLLEIVSGRGHTNLTAKEECVHLLDWARALQKNGDIMELIDPKLGSNDIKEEVVILIELALQCTYASPNLRPTMSYVVSKLEAATSAQDMASGPDISSDNSEEYFMSKDRTQETSLDGPWTGSSSDTQDLYAPNSQYWRKGGESIL